MHLLVASPSQRVAVVIQASATVWELKEKVEKQAGIKASEQELRFLGEALADEMTLAEQGIQDREKIELVLIKAHVDALGGGALVSAQFAVLQAIASKLDHLETKVASERVHPEVVTRVLEELDNVQLDGCPPLLPTPRPHTRTRPTPPCHPTSHPTQDCADHQPKLVIRQHTIEPRTPRLTDSPTCSAMR